MALTRREFLELLGCSGMVAALPGFVGYPQAAEAIKKAIQEKVGNLPVIWIQGQSCAGCSVSTLNTVHPDIAEVLTETISLEFHPNVMAASGDLAMSVVERAITKLKGNFVLVVEGSIPTGERTDYCTVGERAGKPVTIEQWVKELGGAAQAVLAVGTCAAFGGIPAGKPNPANAKGVRDIIPNATVINIPGCAVHPDWVVGTIAHVLLFGVPELDQLGRPKMFFGKLVHEQCERRADFENDKMAADFGDEGCLYGLGCKGPIAYCDAPIRAWNNKVNWCVRSGSPCIGCTEPSFPDHDTEGLYAKLPIEKTYGIAWTDPYAKKKALAG